MSKEQHTQKSREDIRHAFADWIKNVVGIPSEYNRMYRHHLTSFQAGVLWSEATLSTREKRVQSFEAENAKLKEDVDKRNAFIDKLAQESAGHEARVRELEAAYKESYRHAGVMATELETAKATVSELEADVIELEDFIMTVRRSLRLTSLCISDYESTVSDQQYNIDLLVEALKKIMESDASDALSKDVFRIATAALAKSEPKES